MSTDVICAILSCQCSQKGSRNCELVRMGVILSDLTLEDRESLPVGGGWRDSGRGLKELAC